MVINPIVGVYIPIIRIPIKGGMTIPNIATFDHGTCVLYSNHFEMANCWWSMAAATLRVASQCIGKDNLEYVYPILPILPKFLIQLLNES